MESVTLAELRELSVRSRRTQRTGLLALIAGLAAIPIQLVLGAWGAYVAMALVGLAFVGYAYVAGQERGAFRRVFRRVATDRRTRTLVPTGPAEAPLVAQER